MLTACDSGSMSGDDDAAEITVQGTVLDQITVDPINFADVRVSAQNSDTAFATSQTSSSGNFEMTFEVRESKTPDNLLVEASSGEFVNQKVLGFSSSVDLDLLVGPFDDGRGSESDPYQISTVGQLQDIAQDLKGNYIQIENIDATETEAWNGGRGFEPLGDADNPFEGEYDGNKMSIFNLNINRQIDDIKGGIFSYILNGNIEDLNLVGAEISAGSGAGSIANGIFGNSTIINVNVQNSKVSSLKDKNLGAGGIVRVLGEGTKIRSSRFEGRVEGRVATGGLVGVSEGEIIESYSNAEVSAPAFVGGFVGLNGTKGKIKYSAFNGTIDNPDRSTFNDSPLGGFAGKNEGEISNSRSNYEIEHAYDDFGGFVGHNAGEGKVISSYSTGDNNSSSEGNLGGFVGNNVGTVENGFWDTEASSQDSSAGSGSSEGITGITTDQMQGESAEQNMEGFDFEETWQVVTGDYPALFWEDL